MKRDLAKLTKDAEKARRLAEEAASRATDGGSCNLDSTFFCLKKGERASGVVAAIKAAGLNAFATRWIGRGVMICPPGGGQAGIRYTSNEVLCRHLRESGWPVLFYCQMD